MKRAWVVAGVGGLAVSALVVGCIRPTLLTDTEGAETGTGDGGTVSAGSQSGPGPTSAGSGDPDSSGGPGPTTISTSGPVTSGPITTNDPTTISTSDTSDTSGDPPVGITVEGTVETFVLQGVAPGVEVSLYDDPGVTALTDGNGEFSLTPVPAGTLHYFTVIPAPDLWGSVIPVEVGGGPVRSGVDLVQMERSIIDMQHTVLQQQMAAPLDENAALLVVRVVQSTAVMEGAVTIGVDPPLPPNTFYAPDPVGVPVLGLADIEFALVPVMIGFNVPETLPGDIIVSASHPVRVCTPVHAEFPTVGGHMTLVEVDCPPP